MRIYERIRLGTSNSYLIAGHSGLILVDSGNKNYTEKFHHRLQGLNISPDQVKLIVVTHVHFDHVGSLSEIKKLCGCKVAVHKDAANLLRMGTSTIPPGTNPLIRSISWLGRNFMPGITRFGGVEPEILMDEGMDLLAFGAKGRIVHTPGHTAGSISLVLDSGEAFVGDIAIHHLPFTNSVFPSFAEDPTRIIDSWKKIVRLGAKTILPGHGPSFPAEKLEKFIERDSDKRKKKF